MASTEKIEQMLDLIAEVFGAEPVSSVTIAVWEDVLSDIHDDEIVEATRDLLAESKWFPKPAEIRERALNARHGRMRIEFSEEARANANGQEPTYRCLACYDRGKASIYHPGFCHSVRKYASIRERWQDYTHETRHSRIALQAEFEKWIIGAGIVGPRPSLIMRCICDCSAGDKFKSKQEDQDKLVRQGKVWMRLAEGVIRLDRTRTCPAMNGTIQEILDWALSLDPIEEKVVWS